MDFQEGTQSIVASQTVTADLQATASGPMFAESNRLGQMTVVSRRRSKSSATVLLALAEASGYSLRNACQSRPLAQIISLKVTANSPAFLQACAHNIALTCRENEER